MEPVAHSCLGDLEATLRQQVGQVSIGQTFHLELRLEEPGRLQI